MVSGLAIVRGKPSSPSCRSKAHGIRQRRGAPCHPRRPPLHPEFTPPAAVHVEGGVDARRRHRGGRGGLKAKLYHTLSCYNIVRTREARKKLTENANLRAHILMLLLQVKPSACKSLSDDNL
jgi:hypothetical protein